MLSYFWFYFTQHWVLFQVAFEDVLAEPEAIHSADCVWSNSYKCFECGKNCCYSILTYLCGICIALAWGCDFAMVSFNHVWCYTPCMRDWSICIGFFQKLYGSILNCCIGPACDACGRCFSNIVIMKK